MESYKVNNKETGWLRISGDTRTIVAHFKDGHTEKFSLPDFLVMGKRTLNKVIQIDCYKEGEVEL